MLSSLCLMAASLACGDVPQQTAVLASFECNETNWIATALSAEDTVVTVSGTWEPQSSQVLGQLLEWVLTTPGNLVNLGDIVLGPPAPGSPSGMFEECRKAAIEGCGAGQVKDFEWSDSPPICKYHCKDTLPQPKASADACD